MTAFTPEQRVAHARTAHALFGAVEEVTEIPDGYAVTVAATPALVGQAAEFIVLERLCCPFFDFALELPAGSTSFRLLVSGEQGIKPFIRAEFGEVLPGGVAF